MRWGAVRGGTRLLLVGALLVPLLQTTARADASCAYSNGEVVISISESYEVVVVGRTPQGEIYVDFDVCTDDGETATVTNTDVIRIIDTSEGRAATIYLDVSNGGFAPGRTSEDFGTSEIEIEHQLAGTAEPGSLSVRATDAADTITLGDSAVETNADGDADIYFEDLTLLEVYGHDGDDLLTGRGDPVTGGPVDFQVYLRGGDGNDRLFAGDVLTTLEGDSGDDELRGAEGNDYFVGGDGGDIIVGAGGADTTAYWNSPAAVSVDLTLQSVDGGEAEGDAITGIEHAIGSGYDDSLIGNAGSNHLSGAAGDDRLEARAGNDFLQGHTGADTELGGDGDDELQEDHEANGPDDLHGGGGTDTVYYTAREEPVSVTRDDVANDGEADENDNVHSDVEYVRTRGDSGPPPSQSPTPAPSGRSPTPTPSGQSPTPRPSGSTSSSPSPKPTGSPPACRERWKAIDDDGDRSGHSLHGITVRRPSQAWAVGASYNRRGVARTLVEYWNGRSWQRQRSPTYSGQTSELLDVDAPDRGAVWAVGNHSRTTLGTIALRRSGGRWRNMHSPDPGAGLSSLHAVSITDSGVVFAVGTRWDAGGRHLVLIERWRKGRWSVAPVSIEGILDDVYASSAKDVWAVGRVVRSGVTRTLTLHFNGRRWRKVPSPNESSKPHFLLGVDGRGRNDVWAVGYRMAPRSREQPISMRWNGKRWRSLRAPDLGRGGYGQFTAVSAWRNDVVAVGDFSTRRDSFQTLVTSWREGGWEREDMSRFGDSVYLQATEHAPNGELQTAGYRSTNNGSEVILHRSMPC